MEEGKGEDSGRIAISSPTGTIIRCIFLRSVADVWLSAYLRVERLSGRGRNHYVLSTAHVRYGKVDGFETLMQLVNAE